MTTTNFTRASSHDASNIGAFFSNGLLKVELLTLVHVEGLGLLV